MLEADSAFVALELLGALLRHDVTCITRPRLDAALHEPAPPRPRGTRRPTPQQRRPALRDAIIHAPCQPARWPTSSGGTRVDLSLSGRPRRRAAKFATWRADAGSGQVRQLAAAADGGMIATRSRRPHSGRPAELHAYTCRDASIRRRIRRIDPSIEIAIVSEEDGSPLSYLRPLSTWKRLAVPAALLLSGTSYRRS